MKSSSSHQSSDSTRSRAPEAKSSGNEGARGSRGEANSGAQAGTEANSGAREQPQTPTGPDLRKARAQGGGGLASESSRSFEIDEDRPERQR